jgi:hypothetical protein
MFKQSSNQAAQAAAAKTQAAARKLLTGNMQKSK